MYIYSRATVGAFVCLVVLSCCLCQVFYKSCFLWQINDDDDDDDEVVCELSIGTKVGDLE